MPQNLQDFKASFFKSLANPVRVRILEQLRAGPLTVLELQQRLGLDSSNVSQHLTVLRSQSVVTPRREGVNVWYSVEEEQIYAILDAARSIFERRIQSSVRLLDETPL